MPTEAGIPPRPDFTGTWWADLEKSVLRGPRPGQMLQRIEHREPELEQELLVVREGGDEQRSIFRYRTTGDETTNSLGARTVRTRARWEDDELVIESWLEAPGRQFHFKDYWTLSVDGQTLTMAHRDDDLAGQTVVLSRGSASTWPAASPQSPA